jgi:prolipoprotein diacylglyceryltransferase
LRSPAVFALYVAGYSAFRLFEENLRIDYSNHFLGMRLNFWIALIGTLAGLTWFVWVQWGPGFRTRGGPAQRDEQAAAPKARAERVT